MRAGTSRSPPPLTPQVRGMSDLKQPLPGYLGIIPAGAGKKSKADLDGLPSYKLLSARCSTTPCVVAEPFRAERREVGRLAVSQALFQLSPGRLCCTTKLRAASAARNGRTWPLAFPCSAMPTATSRGSSLSTSAASAASLPGRARTRSTGCRCASAASATAGAADDGLRRGGQPSPASLLTSTQ